MTDEPIHKTTAFGAADRMYLAALAGALLLIAVLFFLFLSWQGLIAFPHPTALRESNAFYDYFANALEYRERRLTLALTFRAFITTIGFIVGLVLSVIGGIFILGQKTADFITTGKLNPKQPNALWTSASWSIGTNSPGIIFMIGGVCVILITQMFAIQIGAPEIFPANANAICHPTQEAKELCYTDVASEVTPKQNYFCIDNPTDQTCLKSENE